MIVLFLVALWVLVILARPLNEWKAVLLASMAVAFLVTLATPGSGRRSTSQLPPLVVTLAVIGVAAIAVAVLELSWELVEWWRRRRSAGPGARRAAALGRRGRPHQHPTAEREVTHVAMVVAVGRAAARAGPERPADAAPSAPVAVGIGGTPFTPAWRTLPPVQRSVGGMPLTAPVDRLQGTLASWADPRSVAPLGHLVDPEGPCGRVEGLVRPVGGPVSWSGSGDLSLRQPAPNGRATIQRLRLLESGGAGSMVDDATPAGPAERPLPAVEPTWSVPIAATEADRAVPTRAPLVVAASVPQPTPQRPVVAASVQRQAAPEEPTSPDPVVAQADGSVVHPADAGPALDQVGEEPTAQSPVVADLIGDRSPGTASMPAADDRSTSSAAAGSGQASVQRAEVQSRPLPAGPGGPANPGRVSGAHQPPVVQREEAVQPASAATARPGRTRIGAPLEGPLDVQRLTVATGSSPTPWFPDTSATSPGPAPRTVAEESPSVQPSEGLTDPLPMASVHQGAGVPFTPPVADVPPVGASTSVAPLTSEVTVTSPSGDGPGPPQGALPVQRATGAQSPSSAALPVPMSSPPPSYPGPVPAGQRETPAAGPPVQHVAAPIPDADVSDNRSAAVDGSAGDAPVPEAPLTSAVSLTSPPGDGPAPPTAPPSTAPPSSSVLASVPHAAPSAAGPAVQRTALNPTPAPDVTGGRPDPADGAAAGGPVPEAPLTSAVSLTPTPVADGAAPAAASAALQRASGDHAFPSAHEPPLVPPPSIGTPVVAADLAPPTAHVPVQRAALPLTPPPAVVGRERGGPSVAPASSVPLSGTASGDPPHSVQRSLDSSQSALTGEVPAEVPVESAQAVQPMAPASEPPAVPLPLAPLLGMTPPMGSLAGLNGATGAGPAPGIGSGVPAATLQRSVDGVAATPGPPTARQPASGGVPASSGSAETVPPPVVQLTRAAPSDVGPVGTWGSNVTEVGSRGGPHPRSPAAPVIQLQPLGAIPAAAPRAGLPAAPSWSGSGGPAPLDPAAGAIAAGIASRSPDGSIVFQPPPGSVDASSVATAVSPAVPPAPVDVGAPAGGAAVAGVAPASAPPGPSSAGSSTNLEELARRLFEPLSARLRAELRLERERAGVLTDLRH